MGLLLLVAAVALCLSMADYANAHRGTTLNAKGAVLESNMVGQCGNGLDSYCYRRTKVVWTMRAADRHSWLIGGYWQERRANGLRRGGRYACSAQFIAGPHGVGWLPDTERCHRL